MERPISCFAFATLGWTFHTSRGLARDLRTYSHSVWSGSKGPPRVWVTQGSLAPIAHAGAGAYINLYFLSPEKFQLSFLYSWTQSLHL